MSDLMKEFFERDLKDEEKKRLSKEISSSDESALKFAKLAEDAYRETGLPEPVWRSRDWVSSGSRWWFLKPLLPFLLIVGLSGFVLERWWSANSCLSHTEESPVVRSEARLQPKPEPSFKKAVRKADEGLGSRISPPRAASPSAKTALPSMPPVSDSAATLPDLSESPLPAPLPSGTLPVPPTEGRKYQELSVIVDREISGVARVHVLDSGNNEIRTIYSGILPAGRRVFTWDGKTQEGLLAQPGDYFIEVKSGENILRHKVRINPTPIH